MVPFEVVKHNKRRGGGGGTVYSPSCAALAIESCILISLQRQEVALLSSFEHVVQRLKQHQRESSARAGLRGRGGGGRGTCQKSGAPEQHWDTGFPLCIVLRWHPLFVVLRSTWVCLRTTRWITTWHAWCLVLSMHDIFSSLRPIVKQMRSRAA